MAWRRPGDKPVSEAMMVNLLSFTRLQWVKTHDFRLSTSTPVNSLGPPQWIVSSLVRIMAYILLGVQHLLKSNPDYNFTSQKCFWICCVQTLVIGGSGVREFIDDVIKWKHFPRYWPFVRGIHRSPVNSPHKGQWRGALMFSVICAWINAWINNREAGDLRHHRAHYDVMVMYCQ